MKNFIFIVLTLCILSCGTDNVNKKVINEDVQLYKDLAVCKCMEMSVRTFTSVDRDENYAGPAYTEIESASLTHNETDSIFDSFIYREVIKQQLRHKSDTATTFVAEGSVGKTSYTYECLQLYKSRKLEVLIDSILTIGHLNDR